jgi:hypothetical protein
MDIRILVEWHRSQSLRASGISGLSTMRKEARSKFHHDAAKMIESFADKAHERRLAETERDVKIRAIESLEKLAKRLLEDSKDLKRMLAEDIEDD